MNKQRKRFILIAVISVIVAYVTGFVLAWIRSKYALHEHHPLVVFPYLFFTGNSTVCFFYFLVSALTVNEKKFGKILHGVLICMWVFVFVVFTVVSIKSVI